MARGMLAIALKAGALDIADGSPVTRDNLSNREYHHLFPDYLLGEYGDQGRSEIFRVLNGVLITWNTNRDIGAKDPVTYLRERTARSGLTDDLADEVIRHRLATHVVPYDDLAVGGYSEMTVSDVRRERLRADYQRFLEQRAELLLSPIEELCNGAVWPSI